MGKRYPTIPSNGQLTTFQIVIVPAFVVGCLLWAFLSADSTTVVAGPQSPKITFDQAAVHFQKHYFDDRISRVKVETIELLSTYNDEYNRDIKKENIYLVSLSLDAGDRLYQFSNCQMSDRPKCGWMNLSCHASSHGAELKDLTREKHTVLTYTYDPIRSKICFSK